VYDRTFGDFLANYTVYAPYIHGSGQPYAYTYTDLVLHIKSHRVCKALEMCTKNYDASNCARSRIILCRMKAMNHSLNIDELPLAVRRSIDNVY